jgi:hypothetical protein
MMRSVLVGGAVEKKAYLDSGSNNVKKDHQPIEAGDPLIGNKCN